MKDKTESDKRSYSHKFADDIYALSFSSKPSYKHRLAVGSFKEKDSNKVNFFASTIFPQILKKKDHSDSTRREEGRIR
jgi:hypothetical protein